MALRSGAGAAGGLGFGLTAFACATLKPGFGLVARAARLEARLRRADLVITGEGCLDRSTLMGKGVGELAARCRLRGIPCIALGGRVVRRRALAGEFSLVGALTDLTSPVQALAAAGHWLAMLASVAARRSGCGGCGPAGDPESGRSRSFQGSI